MSHTADAAAPADTLAGTGFQQFDRLLDAAHRDGSVPVIVQLSDPGRPLALLAATRGGVEAHRLKQRRAAIAERQQRVIRALSDRLAPIDRLRYSPYLALRADADILQRLAAMPEVLGVYEDHMHRPALGASVPLIGASALQTGGYDGVGTAVAVLDTGVNLEHEMFGNSVPLNGNAQACFSGSSETGGGGVATASATTVHSFCEDGRAAALAPCVIGGEAVPHSACGEGAADPCTTDSLCWHGTHVAGIAVGNNGATRFGVARGASLVPIQVFVHHSTEGLVAFDSDIIAGLEYVLDLSLVQGVDIAAVNMSLGGDNFYSAAACDAASPAFKEAVDNLRAAGIATVIAAANSGKANMIAYPGCISSAISVGATTKSDTIASYSNRASALNLYAPGSAISSATLPNTNSYRSANGTSMATPHVAGAFAVLRQRALFPLVGDEPLPVGQPGEACAPGLICAEDLVSVLGSALRLSGVTIEDSATGFATPRIQVDDALAMLTDPPSRELIIDAEVVLGDEPHVGCSTTNLDACVAGGTFAPLSDLLEYGCDPADKIAPPGDPGYVYVGCASLTTSYGGDAMTGTDATENRLRYRPKLEPGRYGVWVWWQSFPALGTSVARISVKHTTGIHSRPGLNQMAGGGRWVYLDSYFLDQSSYVELGDGGVPGLIADAVKFAPADTDPIPHLNGSSLPVAYVGVPYSHRLLVDGGTAPRRWSLAAGTPPPGLALSDDGVLEGTPAGPAPDPTVYPFTTRVTDAADNRADQDFEVIVADPGTFLYANINFQPGAVPIPQGYSVDAGDAFGDRGNGLSYGWNTDTSANTRDRNHPVSSDQRYDTANYQPLGTEVWELAVAPGVYELRLIAGDPSYYGDNRRYSWQVEGELMLDAVPNGGNRWYEASATVAVTDGRLTLSGGPNSALNSVNFIDVNVVLGVNTPPSVSMTAPPVGAQFAVGADVPIGAEASDSDGTVAKVEFFANGTKLSEDTEAPYGFVWSGAAVGDHVLTAVATDDDGATTTAAALQVSVYDPSTFLTEIKINFQPAGSAVPADYIPDTGAAFGNRGNGLSYGWNVDTGGNTRDRNDPVSPDERYDTANYQPLGSEVWELALPYGFYEVQLVAGDPSYYGDNRHYSWQLEGELMLDASPNSSNRWYEATTTIAVSDGRLTLRGGPNAALNSINFLHVVPIAMGNVPPNVALTAPTQWATFAVGADIPIAAEASDSDGTVAKIEFFAGGTKLGEDSEAPYGFVWSGAAVGDHVLTAVATDDDGATSTSAALPVSVYDPSAFAAEVKINFQPAGSAVPAGYIPDTGATFGNRGNGLSYGWNVDTGANTRDRNDPASGDQLHDTLNFQPLGTEAWEIVVPNGSYTVRLITGDTTYNGSVGPYRRYQFEIEGASFIDVVPSADNRWPTATGTVIVSDGRLTLSNGPQAVLNSVVALEIEHTMSPD